MGVVVGVEVGVVTTSVAGIVVDTDVLGLVRLAKDS